MTFFGLGQAKVYSGVFLASFLFPGKNTRVGSGTLPQGWPLGRGGGGHAQGKGQPPGQPLPSGRYLSHRFAGRVSKFFSKYSPPGGCLPPPGALHCSEQQPRDNRDPPPAMPSSREKTRRVCGLPRKTRVEAEGPRAGASRRCPPLVSGFK